MRFLQSNQQATHLRAEIGAKIRQLYVGTPRFSRPIRGSNVRALARVNAQPAAVIEIDNREATREAVALGIGIGVMGALEFPSPDKRCVAVTIKDPDLQLTEYVACLEKRRTLRSVREFFRVAAEFGTSAPQKPRAENRTSR